MPRALSRAERETFLADLHTGVVSVADGRRGPIAVPVWYAYEPGGDVVFCTRAATRKARRIVLGTRLAFLVQEEGNVGAGLLPRYVSVEGPVVRLAPADLERDLRPIVHRYLGREIGDGYLQATRAGGGVDEVVVQLHPERWWSRDFGR